jgi:hypothetical protein
MKSKSKTAAAPTTAEPLVPFVEKTPEAYLKELVSDEIMLANCAIFLLSTVRAAQSMLAAYLPPDSTKTAEQTITDLLTVLDNTEVVTRCSHIADILSLALLDRCKLIRHE